MNLEYITDPETREKLKTFQVRDDDVFLVGFPKTGTTWCQEMVWLIENDLNFEEAANKFVDERFPVLELFAFKHGQGDDVPIYHRDSLEFIRKQTSRRYIKTHLSGSSLPEQIQDGSKTPKIIYVSRNPKDTCISLYHYLKNLLKMEVGTLEDFCRMFISNESVSSKFWDHVLYFWNRRHESHILFIKYEDMKNNLPELLLKVATFLGKPLTQHKLEKLAKWLDLESIKKNTSVNHNELYKESGFIRKGKVGTYKEEMSEQLIKSFDDWTRKCLKGSGLESEYDF